MKDKSVWKQWFEESIIVQSVVTLMLLGTICFLYIYGTVNGMDIKIPGELLTFTGIVMGYWFKSKDQVQQYRRDRDVFERARAGHVAEHQDC